MYYVLVILKNGIFFNFCGLLPISELYECIHFELSHSNENLSEKFYEHLKLALKASKYSKTKKIFSL